LRRSASEAVLWPGVMAVDQLSSCVPGPVWTATEPLIHDRGAHRPLALPYLRNYKTVIRPPLWTALWTTSEMCTTGPRGSVAQEAVQLFESEAVPIARPLEHARADEGCHLGGHADLRALGALGEGRGHQSGGAQLAIGAHGLVVHDGPDARELHVLALSDEFELLGGAAAVSGRSARAQIVGIDDHGLPVGDAPAAAQ